MSIIWFNLVSSTVVLQVRSCNALSRHQCKLLRGLVVALLTLIETPDMSRCPHVSSGIDIDSGGEKMVKNYSEILL